MNKQETRQAILDHFTARGTGIYPAGSKGDGFFIQGQGYVSFTAARTMAGLPAHTTTARVPRPRMLAWGEYATIAALNGRLKG